MTGFAGVYREPPANLDAEMMLLGHILMDSEVFHQVSDILAAEHFADQGHQKIYEVIAQQISDMGRASAVTVANSLRGEQLLDALGGERYIGELAANSMSFINAEHHATAIRDAADKRELIGLLEAKVAETWRPDSPSARRQIEEIEAELFQIASDVPSGGFRPTASVLGNALKTIEAAYQSDTQLTSVTSGFADIDKRLRGFQRTDLVILAARPSMGKTAFAINVATNAAKAGNRVAVFSLEMSAEQLLIRAIADETGINSHNIQSGTINRQEFESAVAASDRIKELPLHIDGAAGITPAYLRTELRRLMRREGPVDLVVVDYLQLMSSGSGRRQNSRNDDVSEITRASKQIAKELGVPIIMLSQLSRAVEQREDKRPQLADLRDSGSIEQDADVVLFLYRDEYYLGRAEPEIGTEKWDAWNMRMEAAKGRAEIITAKFRNGAIGTDRLKFTPEFTRFSDWMGQPEQGQWWEE